MSHFYGVLAGNRGQATRGGTKTSGYLTIAASWDGAIQVRLSYDKETEKNHYVVYQSKWQGKGVESEIARSLKEVQENNEEVEIGSYPFFKAGKVGVSIVLSSEQESVPDQSALNKIQRGYSDPRPVGPPDSLA